MNRKVFSAITVSSCLLFVVVLTGCSSQPTLGEQMMEQSSGTAGLGEQWERGHEKVIKGEKLLKQGNEQIKDARDDMREGEDKVSQGNDLIEEGRRLQEDSERQYKLKFPNAIVK